MKMLTPSSIYPLMLPSAGRDGYHDMLMVMQTVSLCDEVTVTLDRSGRVRARSNLRFIPGDERNLAAKGGAVLP